MTNNEFHSKLLIFMSPQNQTLLIGIPLNKIKPIGTYLVYKKRIYHASRNNDKISHFFLLDKCSSEPYILKGARTVLKRA